MSEDFPVSPEYHILGGDFRILALFAAEGGTLRRRDGDKQESCFTMWLTTLS
jgi:hypothetical protein